MDEKSGGSTGSDCFLREKGVMGESGLLQHCSGLSRHRRFAHVVVASHVPKDRSQPVMSWHDT
jgi:hypothetical protein